MNQTNPDQPSLSNLAEQALQQAAAQVIQEALRTNGTVVIWKDGRVQEVSAQELAAKGSSPASQPPEMRTT